MIKIINIEYFRSSKSFEIQFSRNILKQKHVLYKSVYEIKADTTSADLLRFKKDTADKFCAEFPEISLKVVLQGFCKIDDEMKEYYAQKFPNGGIRRGAGRPKGARNRKPVQKRSQRTTHFLRRITPEEKAFLEMCLNSYRSGQFLYHMKPLPKPGQTDEELIY